MTAPDTPPPRPPLTPRHWPMWLGLGVMVVAARLPWLWQRAIGRGVGWLALHLAGTRRRAAQANIELCFPEQSPQWRARLLRDSFDALGVGLFEFARAWWGGLGPAPRPGICFLKKIHSAARTTAAMMVYCSHSAMTVASLP